MTIRNIDDQLKQRLRVRAAQHGCSMEDEVRDILGSTLCATAPQPSTLVAAIRSRIEPLGGFDLELPAREAIRTSPQLGR